MSNIPDGVVVWDIGSSSYAMKDSVEMLHIKERRWLNIANTRKMSFQEYMEATRGSADSVREALEEMYSVSDWNDHV